LGCSTIYKRMIVGLNNRKYKLIQKIINLDQKEAITQLKDQVESLDRKDDGRFLEAVKPMRISISLDEIIKEQYYQPIKKDDLFSYIKFYEVEEFIFDDRFFL